MSTNDETALIVCAVQIASFAHRDQRRKEVLEPYFNHCARVAFNASRLGLPAAAIAAAYLHDVVEDTDTTHEELESMLHHMGELGKRTTTLVKLLTKWWGESVLDPRADEHKQTYYGGIIADEDACALKLLDRADNVRDMIQLVGKTNWPRNYLTKTCKEFVTVRASCSNEAVIDEFDSSVEALRSALAKIGVIVPPML